MRRTDLDRGAVVYPATVTQETSLAVLGLPPRRFREWVQSAQVPHRRLGKLVVVRLVDALAALAPAPTANDETIEAESNLQRLRRRAGLR
jgi:hypothetical protein